MSLFNINSLSLTSTFEGWWIKNNEMITAINTIELVNVQAATNAGLEETFRSGGVVIIGINAGPGITFALYDGAVTLDASDSITKSRTANSDRVLVVENPTSSPVVKAVDASNILPPTVNNDITFAGNVTFSGDISFLTSADVSIEANTAFSDKNLELAVKFRDVLVFATSASITIGTTGYLVDTSIVGDDFSAFDSTSSGTYLSRGSVSAIDTANNEITLSDNVWTNPNDVWTTYTIAGATAGGRYALISIAGATVGRGLQTRTQEKEPRVTQTTLLNANDAGLIVITQDDTLPSGGSEGEKKLTWLYNGSTNAAAWSSTENIAILDGKYLDTEYIMSTVSDTITFKGDGSPNLTTFIFADDAGISNNFKISHSSVSGSRELVISGNSSGAGEETIVRLIADGTIIAGTTALAVNLNADLLDGAQGSTVGGSPNLVPITDSSGYIDQTFIQGANAVNEDITQTNHGFTAGTVLRKVANTGLFTEAKADNAINAESLGIVSLVTDANNFTITYFGSVDASTFDPALGYSGLTSGIVYFLDAGVTGGVTTAAPSNTGEIIKPLFVALSDTQINIVSYIGREVTSSNDAFFAESLVPVGTVLYIGSDVVRYDFLKCDGSLYSSNDYPDLFTAIGNNFYIPAGATGGSNVISIPRDSGITRGIENGSILYIEYNNSLNTLSNAVVTGVTATAEGIDITIDQTLVGTSYYADVKVYGDGNYFFVPDLQSRGLIGTGDADGSAGSMISSGIGDIIDGYTTNGTSRRSGNIALTPVIRAKATGDAFTATQHNHDDKYVSFVTDQSGSFTETEMKQALDNIGANSTDALAVRTDIDISATLTDDEKVITRKNVGFIGTGSAPLNNGFVDLDQIGLNQEEMSQWYVPYQGISFSRLSSEQAIAFASNGRVISAVDTNTQQIQGQLIINDKLWVKGSNGMSVYDRLNFQYIDNVDNPVLLQIGVRDNDANLWPIDFKTNVMHRDHSGIPVAIRLNAPLSSAADQDSGPTTVEKIIAGVTNSAPFNSSNLTDEQRYEAASVNWVIGYFGIESTTFLKLNGTNSPEEDINWGTHRITNLGNPEADQDAATKAYVDSTPNKRFSYIGGITNGVASGTVLASGLESGMYFVMVHFNNRTDVSVNGTRLARAAGADSTTDGDGTASGIVEVDSTGKIIATWSTSHTLGGATGYKISDS